VSAELRPSFQKTRTQDRRVLHGPHHSFDETQRIERCFPSGQMIVPQIRHGPVGGFEFFNETTIGTAPDEITGNETGRTVDLGNLIGYCGVPTTTTTKNMKKEKMSILPTCCVRDRSSSSNTKYALLLTHIAIVIVGRHTETTIGPTNQLHGRGVGNQML
jgi:hypothetical protein